MMKLSKERRSCILKRNVGCNNWVIVSSSEIVTSGFRYVFEKYLPDETLLASSDIIGWDTLYDDRYRNIIICDLTSDVNWPFINNMLFSSGFKRVVLFIPHQYCDAFHSLFKTRHIQVIPDNASLEEILRGLNASIKTGKAEVKTRVYITQRQRQVIECLRNGLAAKDVATRLNLSNKIISAHICNVRMRIGFAGSRRKRAFYSWLTSGMCDFFLDMKTQAEN